jgi:hypothetical protein
MLFGLVVAKTMKILPNKFVRSLSKVIFLAITFYNFAWVYWQRITAFGDCMICPWYREIKDFPIDQFLLMIAVSLLFFKNRWSYSLSIIVSGYFSISWISLIIDWVRDTDYSFSRSFEIVKSQYYGNPLSLWESQVIIATAIFILSIYSLIKEITTKQPKPLS